MINVMKFGTPIKVGSLSADPSSPENGLIYYNTTSGKFRKYEGGAFSDLSTTAEVTDSTFRIIDDGDSTKKIAFQASGITTGTTRTITMPDSNVDLGLIATAIQSSEKGAASGVATLDGSGKIPSSQLTVDVFEYLGNYNATTNSPSLVDGTGSTGDVYHVSVAGTQDFGSGNITFAVGDKVVYSGTVWEKWDLTDAVTSVNGFTGAVSLVTDDIPEDGSPVNLYFTTARARTAAVQDSITNGVTDIAPSQNAVFDALALKLANVSEDTDPQLGGDLDLNGKSLMGPMDRSAVGAASSFIQEEYLHSNTLTASQTNTVLSALGFAHATYEGLEVTYKIKEATTARVRIGTLRIATNGTDVTVVDTFGETGDVGVTWSAVVNGANIDVRYTTTANNKTLRADVKRIKA